MGSDKAKICVVTGGAGFIGSHLVEELLQRGHEVRAVDSLITGHLKNLASVRDNDRFQFLELDINETERLREVCESADWLFHLAALADIVPSIQNPAAYHRANVDGTISVLEAARAAGVGSLLYVASSSSYGIPDVYPTPESTALNPEYPYAFTKMIGEQYVMHWAQVYGMRAISLRFFNVYGPRARTGGTYGAVFGVFLAQKLAGKPLTIVGDGTQTRDFTFVTDVVRAMVTAMESELSGEILNVGSGNTYSVNRLVELIGGERITIPKRPGEPDCTFADTAKIRQLLDWKPQVTLEEGVAIMLEQLENWREAPVWTPETIADATEDWFKFMGKEQGSS